MLFLDPGLALPAIGSRTAALRQQVREFIDADVARGGFAPGCNSWTEGLDPAFRRQLGERGWNGYHWPVADGGRGRSAFDTLTINEELLAAGAPVAAHWIGARQSAPLLMRFGSEAQRHEFLPRIAAGTTYFAIGMSEPDVGSDLASVRTRAEFTGGRWVLDGRKLWTSGAHIAHYAIVLGRTAALDPKARHAGLSQFIVDLRGPGVEIRPIVSMNGAHHSNEVLLDGAFVPDEMVFGSIGAGWEQVTSELSFERSGPERFLSTFVLLDACAEAMASQDLSHDAGLGRLVARVAGLHQMSSAVAGALQRHEPADVPAAVVKVLGTTTEGEIAEFAHLADDRSGADGFSELAANAMDQRPGFTLRGGTNEVLRGVIARGLGLR
jgi:alkylation response protein AidB-like acyl-CoA dehydrogenase